MDAKEILSEIIGFYKYKIDNNLCTPEEIESATRLMQENMQIDATIDDLARFYGKSKDAVNSVIKRRMIAKPKRNVVLYPFHKFQLLVPESWRKKK